MEVKLITETSYVNQPAKFAIDGHAFESRKNGQPYSSHPYRVAKHVKKYMDIALKMKTEDTDTIPSQKSIPNMVTAAWLHDMKENTNISYTELESLFGKEVTELVRELTITPEMRQKYEEAPIEELASEYGSDIDTFVEEIENNPILANQAGKILSLRHEMLFMSEEALIIKLCDRLDNVSDLEIVDKKHRDKTVFATLLLLKTLEENRELSELAKLIVKDIKNTIKFSLDRLISNRLDYINGVFQLTMSKKENNL